VVGDHRVADDALHRWDRAIGSDHHVTIGADASEVEANMLAL
jgi:hypothetical protein